MAASGASMRRAAFANLCLHISFFACITAQIDFPSREEIGTWAKRFEDQLLPELRSFTGIKLLERDFDDLRKAKLQKVDGHRLVHRMSQDLTKNLEKKMEALERLVNAAEEAVKSYKYDPSIQISGVNFVKMKEFIDNDPRLVYDDKYKRGVNFTYSGVHIPVEIYEGYPDILNGLKWSAALDEVFQLNARNDSQLMWQYFGSQSGFMRTYPGTQWIIIPRRPNFPDLYDVRLRPWYVHASSSPKDMIILMDSSGSMHGQTMEIMKIAVKTLLTTLGENDFVNIASFNINANWITCFDTLVQATRRNKQILSKGIDALDDGNIANLSKGLEFAFQAFAKFKENRTDRWAGADCNQVIMLFSDGGTEEAGEVLEKYNADKKTRIFSYAIGPHPVPIATLKEIACSNRGYFTAIQAMGAVRTKIQDYVKVLGRPLVLSTEKNFEWTNLYLDAMGLGMMTTVTLPVFNRTEGGNQSMVGVMGIDIPLHEMLDFEPAFQMGPTGYSFGINHNGYLVFHPDLKTEFEFVDDSPHLDFLDVEIGNDVKEELREAMINLETSKRSLTSLLKMPDEKHIVRHHMEYYYAPVNKTSFSIAVVIPTDRTHYMAIESMDFKKGFDLTHEEMQSILLAPWKYCHGMVLKSSNMSDVLMNFSQTLEKNKKLCNEPLLDRLVWDILKTGDIIDYWEAEERDDKRDKIVATFVQTEGGLTRIYPPSEAYRLSDQINPSRSLIFQRAFYGDDYVFLVPENGYDASSNETDAVITIVKSVSFARSGITYKPAVVGVMVEPLWLQLQLLSLPVCSDNKSICYLIDDGGFIISTNLPKPNVTGIFLGDLDAEIMAELSDGPIFDKYEDRTLEERCKKSEPKVSAGFRISALPFHSTISALNIGWLFDLAAWSRLKYWLLSFFSLMKLPTSEALLEFYELSNETTCNTRRAQYYWGRWGRSYSGNILCDNYTRHYSVAKVGHMNALLLVTTSCCGLEYCDNVPPHLQVKEEVASFQNSSCGRPLRYRRRPDKCYFYSPDENNSECGAVGTLALPHLALIMELLCLMIVTKLVHTENDVLFAQN